MLTKKPSSPKKYLQAVHDTAATSESESEHSEKLQDIQEEKYPSFKKIKNEDWKFHKTVPFIM